MLQHTLRLRVSYVHTRKLKLQLLVILAMQLVFFCCEFFFWKRKSTRSTTSCSSTAKENQVLGMYYYGLWLCCLALGLTDDNYVWAVLESRYLLGRRVIHWYYHGQVRLLVNFYFIIRSFLLTKSLCVPVRLLSCVVVAKKGGGVSWYERKVTYGKNTVCSELFGKKPLAVVNYRRTAAALITLVRQQKNMDG